MKRWIALVGSLSAVAGVVALTLFLAGVFDGDDASGTDGDGTEVAGVCAKDTPDCEDTLVADGGDDAGDEGTGETEGDGVSDDARDGDTIAPVCAPGFPDCVDTIVNGSNDDIDDAVPSTDPIVEADGDRADEAIAAALTDAETRFGVDASEIVVESSAFQVWSNACLDAATDGEACAEIITPGFVIVIDVDGTQYEYHTDLNGNARLAL